VLAAPLQEGLLPRVPPLMEPPAAVLAVSLLLRRRQEQVSLPAQVAALRQAVSPAQLEQQRQLAPEASLLPLELPSLPQQVWLAPPAWVSPRPAPWVHRPVLLEAQLVPGKPVALMAGSLPAQVE